MGRGDVDLSCLFVRFLDRDGLGDLRFRRGGLLDSDLDLDLEID
jgi:hypothetical protein